MTLSQPDQLTYHTYIIQAANGASAAHFHLQQGGKWRAKHRGSIAQKHIHRSIAEIYNSLGPIYFRRAYRMTYESFWCCHDLLEQEIDNVAAMVRGYDRKSNNRENCSAHPIPNGIISSSARLGIALRYFAGGSPYDIMVKFGVSHSSVLRVFGL